MTTPVPVTTAEVNAILRDEAPFCGELNISCDSVGPGVATTRFTYDERFTRPGGFVSGAILTALADVAVFVAIFTRAGYVPMAVTNELTTNFLRPAIGRDVVAKATLHKVGRRVAYASVDLTEDHNPERLVAHATSSYILPDDTT